jgi:fructose-bisphosphate aldolase class I
VFTIGLGIPTVACVRANAVDLARYAALCQEAGLTPIVEPEVLMDGPHSLKHCEEVTTGVLRTVFAELLENRVCLSGALLKPNMVLPGKACPEQASTEQIAEATLRCLRRTVPADLPGIVFLSGGQTPVQATERLNAMNALGPQPWELSFSYGRALQEPALAAWKGSPLHVPSAQAALYHRARCNAAARRGAYGATTETNTAA